MKVAREFIAAPCQSHREYSFLTWNCETFVTMCKIGQYILSEQVEKFMDAIKKDIHSQESIIGNSYIGSEKLW